MNNSDDLNGRLERAGQHATVHPNTRTIVKRGRALRRRQKYIAVAGGTVAVAAVITVSLALIKPPDSERPPAVGSSGLPSASPSEPPDDSMACPPPQVEAGFLPWDMPGGSNPPSHVEREGKVADVYWFPSETNEEFKGAYVQLRRYPYGGPRWGEERRVQGAPAFLQRGQTAEAAIYWDNGGECGNYSVFVDVDRSGGTKDQAADYAYRVADSLRFGQ